MGYTLNDFRETVDHYVSPIRKEQVVKVWAAWGNGPGGSEWDGGFLMKMKDKKWVYVTGWCDYSGWGCQDGMTIEYFDRKPKIETLLSPWGEKPGEWDIEPADLNKWIKDGFPDEGLWG